jgi:hypothetical protein
VQSIQNKKEHKHTKCTKDIEKKKKKKKKKKNKQKLKKKNAKKIYKKKNQMQPTFTHIKCTIYRQKNTQSAQSILTEIAHKTKCM